MKTSSYIFRSRLVTLRKPLACAFLAALVAAFPVHAGDLLRGGATAQAPGAVPVYGATAATTAQARANANDSLARATQAMSALRAMQAAARNLAVSGPNNLGLDPNHPGTQLPNVPNGLVLGGLVPDSGLISPGTAKPVVTWSGAKTPVQTTTATQTVVNVTQTSQQAVLNWLTFNIGRSTVLNIDQSAAGPNTAQWIAFNLIKDPSGVPSQILGSIKAQGQVYVVNQNGIIFGGASQVNVGSLVASSLPINTNLINRGLLNNPDLQFLFSSLSLPAGSNGPTPAFTAPSAPNTSTGRDGDVTVQPGAQITAADTANHNGGLVALIGPNVNNAGTISTPDGQTILAAGNEVGLLAHPSSDPSLRGLDVTIGKVDSFSGAATNSGVIEAQRADVTIAGKTVSQLGGIDGTTSVALNGRIDLEANYAANVVSNGGVVSFNPTAAGTVVLGPGSIMQILPETADTDTVVGTQLALPSQINIQGLAIDLAANSTILAPNANVAINAGNWLPVSSPLFSFVYTNGQIYMDMSALIDVAGSVDVNASVSQNIVSAQLFDAQLANSPLQKTGPLAGQTVQVDITQSGVFNGFAWVGSPIGDLSGYANLVLRTVGELTTAGGSVTLKAGNSVVMQPGSAINVSGGWINFQGGMVQTTKVVSSGHIYDISQATPNLVYQGILGGFTVDDAKWGVSETFGTPLIGGPYYESGYLQGGNGGSISITAPSMALDGNLLGNTDPGPRQRAVPPVSSSLSLVFQSQNPNLTVPSFYPNYSPTPPAIIFASGVTLPAVGPFALNGSGSPLPLPAGRLGEVALSPALVDQDGFSTLAITDSDGSITLPANVPLAAAPGGSFTLQAANMDIEGSISTPGGSLSFTVFDISPYVLASTVNPVNPPVNPARGHFTLGPAGSLNTAGLVIDDLAGSPSQETQPLETTGGQVTIAAYNVVLSPGGSINVSGGVDLTPTGGLTYGNGGSINLTGGQDPLVRSVGHEGSGPVGSLVLGASLAGYAGPGAKGGTLAIQDTMVQIGGNTLLNGDTSGQTLLLSPAFFDTGGFDSYKISGLGEPAPGPAGQYDPGLLIAPGVVIAPVSYNWLAGVSNNTVTLTPALLQQGVRSPVSLTFSALGISDQFNSQLQARGDVVMKAGSVIQTDPGASVTLSANTVTVLGDIIVPGGSITIKGANTFILPSPPSNPMPTVDIGPTAFLSTAGTTLLTPDPTGKGYRTGSVLNGGSINISGNIVAEGGAVIDVAGATDVLDLSPAASGLNIQFTGLPKPIIYIPTREDSNGGSITFSGGQELFMDGQLLGGAGGPSAVGGSLSVSSGIFSILGTPPTPLQATIIVTQNGPTIPAPFYTAGQTAIGNPVMKGGSVVAGLGYFAANSFNNSGLSYLTLQGPVQFSGPVSLTANGSITISSVASSNGLVLFANAGVSLNAPYVALGVPFLTPSSSPQTAFSFSSNPFNFAPTFGTGGLTVNASLIDLGNLSLQSIGNASFTAADGDIRGDGTLDIAGRITLTAGQIYPPTETSFTIAAYNYQSGGLQPGTVTIVGSGARLLPLSAGGVLSIYASVINQGGVLRAPMGTINLGWDGVGTAPVDNITNKAVTATQQLNLQGGSVTSVSAIDPITGQGLLIPYGINVNGNQWIDPAGTDITAGGVPAKAVNISAVNVADQAGATIDIRGGGGLFAYRFVSGTGGNTDILASASSFAILPGYQAAFAPDGAYANATNLGGDLGYVNGGIRTGQEVWLAASNGLPAGYYTLLPARYALLPGAFLVTPQSGGVAPAAVMNPDGSSIVPGYMVNGLVAGRAGALPYTRFEVDPQAVVQSRAEYDISTADSFLRQGALSNGVAVPRLPADAGQLVFIATQGMSIQGTVFGGAPAGGLGAQIDISSPNNILIAAPGATAGPGTLVLNATELDSFGAESLLIGGVRQTGTGGETVSVTTNSITVNNAGAPLIGEDVILAANQAITLSAGADVESSGAVSSAAQTLLLGNSSQAGSGNGVLLRVSSDPAASISRSGVASQTVQAALAHPPVMTIGAGVTVKGNSVTLDSTYSTLLDPTATISGNTVNLNSGQISIQLSSPGPLFSPTAGLVLPDVAVQTLESNAQFLSLLSYSSIDVYGSGTVGAATFASLALHTAELRGFNNAGGVAFDAQSILLDNSASGSKPGAVTAPTGPLTFNAGTILLGVNQFNIDQFSAVTLNATGGILAQSTGGFATQGSLAMNAPVVTGAAASNETITAAGAITITSPAGETSTVTGGLGATLALTGSAGITVNGNIFLPSGVLTLHATSGDVVVGNLAPAMLDAGGSAKSIFDLVEYTSGGAITISADAGNVTLGPDSTVNIAAQPGGGNGGSLTISAPTGIFTPGGTLLGQGGLGGVNGTFTLDVKNISGGSLSSLDSILTAGGFTQSVTIRVRSGDILVDGSSASQNFNLSTDTGSITVTGTINASGATGGTINLIANGSVNLQAGSLLTVAGLNFSDAGQGGAVSLEAGSETNGSFSNVALGTGPQVNIMAGSTIDLSVINNTNPAANAALGDFNGTLHLRAPQALGNTDVQIKPVNGNIINAASILVEGYQVFNASSNGSIDNQEANVFANGNTFAGAAGTTTAGYTAMLNRLFANNTSLKPLALIEPGAEIINTHGNLTLANDWDLANSQFGAYRFGPNQLPGVLTIRASGNLIFNGALSDGFQEDQGDDNTGNISLWEAPLLLPGPGSSSYTYNLTAGADFSAANGLAVQTNLAAGAGSLMLGVYDLSPFGSGNNNTTTSTIIFNNIDYYQVIRTGNGNINISTGGSVLLLNQFATIYTAGVQVEPPANFSVPDASLEIHFQPSMGAGAVSEDDGYPQAQYSAGGGNVTITALGDIAHQTINNSNQVIADSELELPDNWLYRRGFVNPVTGQFGTTTFNGFPSEVGSTTWWVDFSNFFEGVGALGGGNVTMIAGHNITNVDAVVPTNAYMPGSVPNAANLVELGGGDLLVRAGNNISGGVYYVERGQGTIVAGNSILTNSTRIPGIPSTISAASATFGSNTWLPTTLYLGDGSFDVSASGNVLLGPVVNPFLLPEGLNNGYWNKSYFSTYASTDTVDVSSLTGGVTFREDYTIPNTTSSIPILLGWLENVDQINPSRIQSSPVAFEPWLGLDESSVNIAFDTVVTLEPGTLRATAFSGDIDIVGGITLSPSPVGSVDFVAAGSINGLQPNGVGSISVGGKSLQVTAWAPATINLSDANPASIPGVATPLSYQQLLIENNVSDTFSSQGVSNSLGSLSLNNFLTSIDSLFNDSGSVEGIFGVLQTQLALHSNVPLDPSDPNSPLGPLHAGDPDPLHLYSGNGSISGLTLFSAKSARVIAGSDITDISLYVQNVNAGDITLVNAGRDIIAYDPSSPLRIAAEATGNAPDGSKPSGNTITFASSEAGDIQIAGPGTLEVLSGRNLNLGIGPNNADGTGVGLTSIGNQANPNLPFGGASIIAGAGIGNSFGLDNSPVDFTAFIAQFLNPATGGAQAQRYLPDLAVLLQMPGASNTDVWTAFNKIVQQQPERADGLALDVFYLVLRDAGRDHNNSSSPGFGNYTEGFAAAAALFPGNHWQGDISLTSREIKTANGGDISIFAPGGQIEVGLQVNGTQPVDQGILTEDGGNISIYTEGDVSLGTSRIFTLRGGNEIIWSSNGNIAAGASSKTVQSAPPTRVLIDPQSATVETDLAGLATGGGIGVLESIAGVPPGNVDLIAPVGTIDAGQAGIRVSGNLNISAKVVLNASNISVGGASVGTPAAPSAPNVSGITQGSSQGAANNAAATDIAKQQQENSQPSQQQDIPSVITVEVLGYGGGDALIEDPKKKKPEARRDAPGSSTHNEPPLAINAEAADNRLK